MKFSFTVQVPLQAELGCLWQGYVLGWSEACNAAGRFRQAFLCDYDDQLEERWPREDELPGFKYVLMLAVMMKGGVLPLPQHWQSSMAF